jgi:hypothetical protein
MELATKTNNFYSPNEGVEFEIESSPKMMSLLSDNLYQNKIKAPIRELSTNALDAHIEAGCPEKPFKVEILSDKFTIRDFGTGLSQEFMETKYRRYGASNKTHSNDFNGCMGLGSKSPLAYTNSFVTSSYYNGRKFTYITSKDEVGKPKLILVSEEDTNEPNGLEVSFSIKPGDKWSFKDEAKSVYEWFKVKPDINVSLSEQDFSRRNNNWGVRTSSYGNESIAVMGSVAYPIDVDKLRLDKSDSNVSIKWANITKKNLYTSLLEMDPVLFFNVGEIEMDIGREGLQYNTKTINAVVRKLDMMLKDIELSIEGELSLCKTYWDACRKFVSIKQDHSSIGHFFKNIHWNNIKLRTQYCFKNVEKCIKFTNISYKEEKPWRISNEKFFVSDLNTGNYSRIKLYKDSPGQNNEDCYLLKFENDDAKKLFLKENNMLDSELTRTSTLPKPPKKIRNKAKVRVFSNHYSYGGWDEKEIDFDAGGVYVLTNRGYPTNTSNGAIVDKIKLIPEPLLIGVIPSKSQRYVKSSKWMSWHDYVVQETKKIADKDKENIKKYIKYIGYTSSWDRRKDKEWISELSSVDNPELQDFLKEVKEAHAFIEEVGDKYGQFAKTYEVEELPSICDFVRSKFPMCKFVDFSYCKDRKVVVNYIKECLK